jgi:hypothetical protein
VIKIQAQPIKDYASLCKALQNAIKLEHATIPPYLIAYYTLIPTNAGARFARGQIRSIVIQEMVHMTLACNILNAIGGTPKIADPDFIPKYPGPLPMGIQGDLDVHLKRYSRDLVKNVFMRIEEPECPVKIPVKGALLAVPTLQTIGQFYSAIEAELMREDKQDHIFSKGDIARQVGQLDTIQIMQVTDIYSAMKAISTIVTQGEGTSMSPASMGSQIAHYYTFEQFVEGMQIVQDEAGHFVFDPQKPIQIDDQADVIQMVDDPELVTYEAGDQQAAQSADRCDQLYSQMLRVLHQGFNGQPDKVNDAIALMSGDLRKAIRAVLDVQITAGPNKGLRAGPRFRFVP